MRGLMGVTEQALPQGQRINGEGQAIDQRMPAIGIARFDRGEVTLYDALVPQWAERLQLAMAHATAGDGKILEQRLIREFLIKREQFAELAAAGVKMGGLNGGQLDGPQDAALVIPQENAQCRQAAYLAQRQRSVRARQRGHAVGGAELQQQGREVPEQLDCRARRCFGLR